MSACKRCGSVAELEQAHSPRPGTDLCHECWCELDAGRARKPAQAVRGGRCADCRQPPSRGHPLGNVYDDAGRRRAVCVGCYLKLATRPPEPVEHFEPLESDQIFERAAELLYRGRLDRADALGLIRGAHAVGGWSRRDELHARAARLRRELQDGVPALVELANEQLLEAAGDGAELRDSVDEAADVIRCCLVAWQRVAPGEFCSWRPILNGLGRVGLGDSELVDQACGRLGVERRRCGGGERWRLPVRDVECQRREAA